MGIENGAFNANMNNGLLKWGRKTKNWTKALNLFINIFAWTFHQLSLRTTYSEGFERQILIIAAVLPKTLKVTFKADGAHKQMNFNFYLEIKFHNFWIHYIMIFM